MGEWAKVVIYPLGLCGFALFLLWRIYARAQKAAARGEQPASPIALQVFAGIAMLGGLGLAYLQIGAKQEPAPVPAPGQVAAGSEPASASPVSVPASTAAMLPEVRRAPLTDDPPERPRVIDLSGTWHEQGASAVSIVQRGRSMVIRIPVAEVVARALGIDGNALAYQGELEECTDGEHMAHAELATAAGARLSLRLVGGGRRLEGALAMGGGMQPVVLTRE